MGLKGQKRAKKHVRWEHISCGRTKYITRSVARCLKRFKKHGVAAFTPHDLRRNGRTGLTRFGVNVDIAERVLNHARERMEATYDVHDYLDEKREALEKWAKYLAALRAERAAP